jgi:branched-chain amino acid transport system ATP-binding protein
MPPLLEVRDLHVSYGRLPALQGVDVAVPEGSLVALLGPNGAGKSTLLKTIAGLVSSRSGSITLSGDRIDKQSPHQRAKNGVCLIPEGRGIFPSLTVAENLQLAIDGSSGRSERVFEHFPVLKERRQQLAGTLSGGEQQMLALARAVGSDPTLLMADELSLGLAPKLVTAINETLREIHEREGRTILMVEQYATHALRVADLVYILGRGKLVWAGEPDELRASKVLVESYLGGNA